jgi:hypothetical protein
LPDIASVVAVATLKFIKRLKRLIVENHVQQGTVVKAFVPIAPSALSSDCSVPGVHNENILSAMGF